jgi:hypothetical protein
MSMSMHTACPPDGRVRTSGWQRAPPVWAVEYGEPWLWTRFSRRYVRRQRQGTPAPPPFGAPRISCVCCGHNWQSDPGLLVACLRLIVHPSCLTAPLPRMRLAILLPVIMCGPGLTPEEALQVVSSEHVSALPNTDKPAIGSWG